MKNLKTLSLLLLLSAFPFCLIAGNPLEVKTYKLPNGLTVYLNEDHSKPEIFGAVIVKTGSRNDPQDATGIAHYFEHIMFKGTDQIGTIDWKSEKIYLDSISMFYDNLAKASDENIRREIQREINRLSIKAAEYAIPNETDVLLRDIGGTGLNAGTGFEQTVYYNSFPAYQLEKWMEIYAERFRNPVFRLFQSELETVYEEKNLYSDVPVQMMIEDFLKTMYKDHPYSIPILGLTEHLKNPRLSQMLEFYNTWYVANNMALILAGSFNAEEIMPMIEEKFGNWRNAELPDLPEYPLAKFESREFKQVRLSPIRIGVMGFRAVPAGHPDDQALKIATKLLSNGAGTGIFDKMMMENKIMAVQPMALQAPDHGSYLILFVPKIIGQSFKKAESLVDEGVLALRSGSFTDELLEAIKLEYLKEYKRSLETAESRAYLLIEAFVENQTWEDIIAEMDAIEKISRDDVIRVANNYLGNDRLVYWSKMGFPKKDKLEKPEWEPVIPQNADKKSEFASKLDAYPESWPEPEFISFDEDVRFEPIKDGYDFYHTHNPYNDVFTLNIKYKKGALHDKLLPSAVQYINLVGTEEKSFQEYRSELQQLGASLSLYSDDNSVTVQVEGFDDKFIPTLQLVNEMLVSPGIDDTQLDKFLQGIKSNNKMRRDDPMSIGNALFNYALYTENSADIRNLTYAEAKKLKGEQLISLFKEVLTHTADIIYTGSLKFEEAKEAVSGNIQLSEEALSSDYIELARQDFSENTIYMHHNGKARQSNINYYVQGNVLSEQDKALTNAFNEYFGSGMSSLVFQEIREFRSLSYAAYAVYNPAFLKTGPAHLIGYMNTQSDKTLDGIQAMSELILQMPSKPDRMEGIRKALMQSIYTSQPGFREVGNTVARWRMQGYDSDPRVFRYSIYNRIDFNDVVKFYKEQLGSKPLLISVSGNLKGIDRKELEAYGKLVELKYKDFVRE
jgi:zinc protease